MAFLSDIEIAQACEMKPITEIAKKAQVDEKYLAEDGNPDIEKMKLITFDPVHHTYIQLGNKVGFAFFDGRELK